MYRLSGRATMAFDATAVRRDLVAQLRASARPPKDPDRAQSYLGSPVPVLGVRVPKLRAIVSAFRRAHRDLTEAELIPLTSPLWGCFVLRGEGAGDQPRRRLSENPGRCLLAPPRSMGRRRERMGSLRLARPRADRLDRAGETRTVRGHPPVDEIEEPLATPNRGLCRARLRLRRRIEQAFPGPRTTPL